MNEQILATLKLILDALTRKSDVTTVNQQAKRVYWLPYTYTSNQVRVFNCNAIVFTNQGTGNVIINSVYTLQVGDSLSLECDENEIDTTNYSISFASGFVNKLAVFYKINEGVTSLITNAENKLVPPVSRRERVKQYMKNRGRGDF